MTIITANEALLQYIHDADGPVAVRDSKGNVVGFFSPVTPERVSAYARALFQLELEDLGIADKDPTAEFDLADAERRLALPSKGTTLDAVFEVCQLLTDDPAQRADLQRHIEDIRERNRCASR